MKKKIKIVSVVVMVVLMVIYGVYAYLQPMTVETETISAKDSAITFTESGIVVHSGEKIIFPLISGEIVSVLVKEGESVKKGQELATLNRDILDSQIKQALSLLEGYEAQLVGTVTEHEVGIQNLNASRAALVGQLSSLKAQLGSDEQKALEKIMEEQSKAIYDQGLLDLEKNRELFNSGIISESEFIMFEQLVGSYETNYLQSQISASNTNDTYQSSKNALNSQIYAIDTTLGLDTLSASIAYYQSLVDGAKASYEILINQSNYYSIKAPIDGVINSVTIENTNMVTGMEPAFIVQGTGDVVIEVKVSSRDIETVQVGDKVKLLLDQRSGDLELVGTVNYIASNAVVELSPLGIEERKVLVFIKPESSEKLRAGYELDTKFTVFSQTNKLIVPNSALYKVDEQDTVMVIRNGKATEIPVTLGYELTGETIVDDGLVEGEVVIVDLDASGLVPGKSVISSNE